MRHFDWRCFCLVVVSGFLLTLPAEAQDNPLQSLRVRGISVRTVQEPDRNVTYAVGLRPDCDPGTVVAELAATPIGSRISSLSYSLYFMPGGASSRTSLNLSGIERLTGLRALSLTRTSVAEWRPLASLRSLRTLELDGVPNLDLEAVGALTQLEDLTLYDIGSASLEPLHRMNMLRRLKLGKGAFVDLNALADLPRLTHLELWYPEESFTFTPVAQLTNLTSITLYGRGPRDIRPLTQLPSLRSLDMQNQWIENYGAIARMAPLRHLRLFIDEYAQPRVDLSFIGSMTQLEDLALGPPPDSGMRMAWLRNLRNLRSLYLVLEPEVADIEALQALTALRTLQIFYPSDTRPRVNLSGLASLVDLQKLVLHGVDARDYSPLARLGRLEILDLAYSNVRDVSFVQGLSQLQRLDLGHTEVASLSPLETLPNLTWLSVVGTRVRRIEPVTRIASLRHVGFDGAVSDYSLLENLPELDWRRPLPTGAALRRLLESRTAHTFSPTFGNQIEYTSADGRAYLWFPGNTAILVGEWRLRGSERVCFRYPAVSINASTGVAGGEWECSHVSSWLLHRKASWSGDVYNLERGGPVPADLSPFGDIPPIP